jgi:hypothetical protein
MQDLSPIILFVYNRPWHTKETLNTLEKSNLAQDSILYVFSDGAKTSKQDEEVNEVRRIIREAWNFKNIYIIERKKNIGLAANVIDGVSTVIQKHKRAIVLEDDVLLSPCALQYFNDALTLYVNEEKVMHIGSYMYNIDKTGLDETFFTRLVSSQAWATWDRAWKHFEPDTEKLITQFDRQKIKAFSFEHSMNFWRQINLQRKGLINSWAVRWYASVFLQGGLGLQCSSSLITNIGHDGTGIHSAISDMFDAEVKKDKVTYFPTTIVENVQGYHALKYFFKHRKGSLIDRLKRWLKNKLHNLSTR